MAERDKHEKLGKRAVAVLKKEARACAKDGLLTPFRTTAEIMRSLGLEEHWNTRAQAYRELRAALERGAQLGLIERDWARYSPQRYRYTGEDVEEIRKEVELSHDRRVKEAQRAIRRLRLRDARVYGYRRSQRSVEMPLATFMRLVELAEKGRAKCS